MTPLQPLVRGPRNAADAEPPLPLHGDADRFSHRDGNDDYTQPGNLFRLFDDAQKQRLFDNLAAAMQGVPETILRRQIAHFSRCDPAYGAGVARALKLDPIGATASGTTRRPARRVGVAEGRASICDARRNRRASRD